jgi:hypothetical protein
MKHEAAQDLLADFALGLLDYQDEAAVQAHIEGCGDCRGDLQLFLQAGEALAFAPTTVELPAGTAGRIAAGVRARLDPPHPQTLRSNVIIGPWRNLALGAAAAVFLLAVGLTAVTMAWLDARDEADRLEGQLAARAIELPLSGDSATGTIYVAADFTSGVARFTGLGKAPTQHHYQVWSEGPGGATSAADFTGSEGELLVRLPELPRDMTRMFVTIEPDGATGKTPSGPEVLSTPH